MEAEHDFTFKGQPINPAVVYEFVPWLSEGGPRIVSVDLEDSQTHQYSGHVHLENRYVVYETPAGKDNIMITYERIGRTKTGVNVLRVAESEAGGSGVWMELLFVEFSSSDVYDHDRYSKRLLMNVTGIITLGDRDDSTVAISGNDVIIGPSKYRKHEEIHLVRSQF